MQLKNNTSHMLCPIIEKIQNEVKPMNICFLVTHVPNSRINKRIEVFKNAADTKVICTRRASQNIWEPSQDVEHFIYDIDLPSTYRL